jgi:hypothetical protein
MNERKRFVFEHESGASLSTLSLKGIDTIPIEKALNFLASEVDDLETNCWVCGEFIDDKYGQVFPHHLTRCEAIAIRLYTLEWSIREESLYYKMCQALRSADRQVIKPYLYYLKLLLCGLNKFPSYSGHTDSLWRGVIDDDGKIASMYSENMKKLWWWGFSSCSYDMNTVTRFFGNQKKVLFNIHFISHAVDISELSCFPIENEILLLPARYLQVINSNEVVPGLRIIQLKELKSPQMITGIEMKPLHSITANTVITTTTSTTSITTTINTTSTSTINEKKEEAIDWKKLVFRPPDDMTDEGIKHLTNITNLNLHNNIVITNEGIKHLTNIASLNLDDNEVITNEGIKHLTNITSLDLTSNGVITNEGIKHLTNISSLYLFNNVVITNEGIKHLTNITNLKLERNGFITNEGIKHLTNITSLDLKGNRVITNEGIKHLTNISSLNLYSNELITNEGIKHLTNITSLNLIYDGFITNEGIKHLTNITSLNLGGNVVITNEGIKHLTNIASLNLGYNKVITNEGIKHLTNITSLDLGGNVVITNEGIKHLTNITSLDLTSNGVITNEGIKHLTKLMFNPFSSK